MSNDTKVAQDLIQTLKDGSTGFADAAQRLDDSNRPDLATKFRAYSEQRGRFVQELEQLCATSGVEVDASGSTAAAIHRGWMAFKDVVSGSDPDGVLDVAEQGEDHAVSEYTKALEDDISVDLRTTVLSQYTDIRAAHNEVKMLKDSVS